jgi:hypothetical protein
MTSLLRRWTEAYQSEFDGDLYRGTQESMRRPSCQAHHITDKSRNAGLLCVEPRRHATFRTRARADELPAMAMRRVCRADSRWSTNGISIWNCSGSATP